MSSGLNDSGTSIPDVGVSGPLWEYLRIHMVPRTWLDKVAANSQLPNSKLLRPQKAKPFLRARWGSTKLVPASVITAHKHSVMISRCSLPGFPVPAPAPFSYPVLDSHILSLACAGANSGSSYDSPDTIIPFLQTPPKGTHNSAEKPPCALNLKPRCRKHQHSTPKPRSLYTLNPIVSLK